MTGLSVKNFSFGFGKKQLAVYFIQDAHCTENNMHDWCAEWGYQLKHVKAWLKPNLHKIRKTVITLVGFGLIFAELAA